MTPLFLLNFAVLQCHELSAGESAKGFASAFLDRFDLGGLE